MALLIGVQDQSFQGEVVIGSVRGARVHSFFCDSNSRHELSHVFYLFALLPTFLVPCANNFSRADENGSRGDAIGLAWVWVLRPLKLVPLLARVSRQSGASRCARSGRYINDSKTR